VPHRTTNDLVDVTVMSSGHDAADARLHRIVTAIVDAGLHVEVLCLGAEVDGPSLASSTRTWPRGGLWRRVLLALEMPWRATGRVLVVLDPDLVPAGMVRRALGRALVVDLSEDYLTLLQDRAWARGAMRRPARWFIRLAMTLAARADITAVADEHVRPIKARQRLVLRNLPFGDVLPAPTRPDPIPRAIYVGDIRRSRGLFEMLEAIAVAPGWILDLVGQVAAADATELANRLALADLAGRVRLHGRRPPADSWQLARGAWVGFSLLHDTPAFRLAMPSKIYEYLACGLPVIATPLPRQAELINSVGAGVIVADAQAAATTLVRLGGEPGFLAELRAAVVAASSLLGSAPDASRFGAAVAELVRLKGR